MPGLLKHFQAAEINELIVPRAHLSCNGRRDRLTPPAGVERIRDHLLPLYEKYGRQEDCRIELFDCGHEETPAMRKLVLAWLDRYLLARRLILNPPPAQHILETPASWSLILPTCPRVSETAEEIYEREAREWLANVYQGDRCGSFRRGRSSPAC